MTQTKRQRQTAKQPEGLVGFFGHTYIPDPDDADSKVIQYQFQIIRKMDETRYVFQYFSFSTVPPPNSAS
jgi:hypothetical protein